METRTIEKLVLVAGLSCTAASQAFGQGVFPLHKVIHNQDPTAIAGTTWSSSNAFPSGASIDQTGVVAFRATLATGGTVTTSNNQLAEYGTAGSLSYMARTGDQAPGLPAGVNLTTFSAQTIPRSAAGGLIWMVGNTTAPSGYVAVGTPGSLTAIARNGDAIGGGTLTTSPVSTFGSDWGVNSSGQIVFGGTVSGVKVCFIGSPGNIQEVYRNGVSYSGLPSAASLNNTRHYVLHNAGGDTTCYGAMTLGGAITESNNEVLFSRGWNAAQGSFTILAREGDPAPGCGGATYAANDPSVTFTQMFQRQQGNFNNAGQSMWSSYIEGTGVVPDEDPVTQTPINNTTANNVAVFYGGADGTPHLWHRRTDPVACIPGTQYQFGDVGGFSNATEVTKMHLNNNGDIAYSITLTQGVGGVTDANDHGLIRASLTGPTQTLIGREGDAVSALPGALFGDVFAFVQQNNAGQVVFMASLVDDPSTNVGNIDSTNNSAIFAWDPVAGLRLILQTGANLSSLGIPMICTGINGLFDAGNVEGGSNTLADNGRLVFTVTGTPVSFSGVTSAIITTQIPVPPTCGSADFNCDGDLGTDADIEAFFACLAGDCPAAPCNGSADFNGDGDLGTDADIEAFFRVLAGGTC